MNDAFAKHGIGHLSPSALLDWRELPAFWVIKYLFGKKFDAGPRAWRGKAVEDAMTALLHGCPPQQALDIAYTTYNANAAGEISDDIEGQRAIIPGMVRQVQSALADQALDLVATQTKIEHWMDGISVPIVGYADYLFTESMMDLKTQEKMPPNGRAKPDHVRQVSVYWAARQLPQTILYVTEKKFLPCPVTEDECRAALDDVRADALSLEAFLARADCAMDALHMLPLNCDHWKISDEVKTAHKELLGI